MKVLCIVPPYIPSYFNAGHHLPVFQVAAYLRKHIKGEVTALDCGALNTNWREICTILAQRFDMILMLNDFDAIDGFERFVRYAREISPKSKLATFGRASRDAPAFFDRFGFDGIGSGGDYEISMRAFINFDVDGEPPAGLRTRTEQGTYKTYPASGWLSPDEWVLPEVSEIPYGAYARLYETDLNKFCGIPQRKELIIPVARGCPVGCEFCDVPRQQGKRERRLSVERVVEYIRDVFQANEFEYVSFYAPTFTLKREWVLDLCKTIQDNGIEVPWKCVTTVAHLDEHLIQQMARAGCVRISVGVESFSSEAEVYLPKLKQKPAKAFLEVAHHCKAVGIELNCFLIFGFPGEAPEQIIKTVGALIKAGHRVRPTVYTPYLKINENISLAEFSSFNRQIFIGDELSRAERDLYYLILYANELDVPTNVQNRVPARLGHRAIGDS